METHSLASGTSGGPLSTGRPPAFLPSSTGAMFAREVERASERSHGDGLEAKRLEELAGKRRSSRRASFERPEDEQDAQPVRRSRNAEMQVAAAHPAVVAPARAFEPVAGAAPDEALLAHVSPEPRTELRGVAEDNPGAQAAIAAPLAQAPATKAPSTIEPAAAPAAGRTVPQPNAVTALARQEKAPGLVATAPKSAGPDPALLERAEEILRQIKLHLAPGVRRITLDLEPADLGRLAVQLALRAGKVTTIVRSENPETLALLQQREADLRQVFAQRGIQADSIRFELGFGGHSSGWSSPDGRATSVAGPRPTLGPAAATFTGPSLPRSNAVLVDTLA